MIFAKLVPWIKTSKMNNQINSVAPKYWGAFKELAIGVLNYGWNQMTNEILYWTENKFRGDKMGMWGFDLYQNDMTLDIKDEFEKLLSTGKTSQEITDEMLAEYRIIIGDIDEEPLFWLALADTQWNWGVLLPPVKEKALYWINQSGSTFPRHSKDAIELGRKQWEKTVLSLKKKLLSPTRQQKSP